MTPEEHARHMPGASVATTDAQGNAMTYSMVSVRSITEAITTAVAQARERIDQNASVIALVACANCTHQPDGSAACSQCIADAVRTRQP